MKRFCAGDALPRGPGGGLAGLACRCSPAELRRLSMGFSPIAWSRRKRLRPYLAVLGVVALGAGAAAGASAASASTTASSAFTGYQTPSTVSTTLYRSNTSTPIKPLVVIFDENESFDHYFGTYPYAANTDGTTFTAKKGTPSVNGLYSKITKSGPTGPLLT